MFGIDLTDFVIGGAVALVGIQFYPPLAKVGVTLIETFKKVVAKVQE